MEPYLVDVETIKKCSESIGKSNRTWNYYSAILKKHDEYIEFGLTPEIYVDPLTGGIYITTEEFRTNRMH